MTKIEKEKIEKILTSIVGPYDATFRFRTAADPLKNVSGYFNPETREIVVKRTASIPTIAHEIAHAQQYHEEGSTNCKTGHGVARHHKLEQAWISDLQFLGIEDELYSIQ